MVLNYFWIFSLLVSFSVPLFFLRKHRDHPNLPPGRLGWPVVGESLAFQSAIREGHPEKFFFDRSGPDRTAFKTSLLGEPTVVLCGAAGNKFVFSNEDKLVMQWFPLSLAKLFSISVSASVATRTAKKLLLPSFLKIEALRRSVGVMDEVAQRHFAAEWGGGGESIFVARLAKRYTFRAAASLLASLEDPKEIKRWEEPFNTVAAGVLSLPIDLPGTALNRAMKAIKVMREEVLKVVRRRKTELAEGKAGAGPAHDYLSHMLVMRKEDGQFYSELQIANYIMSLFQASHATTSSACASVVKYLAELPHVYEAVYNEQMTIAKSKAEGETLNWEDLQSMKYSWNVAQEVLRIAPPSPGMFREAVVDFSYGGFTVPKGWKIFWSTNASHKNPAHFPNPESFDPTRFEGSGPAPHTFIPFGGGLRMCPGIEYARVKILVFMHNLVKHCPWEKIVLE